jgi:hypothetical protein
MLQTFGTATAGLRQGWATRWPPVRLALARFLTTFVVCAALPCSATTVQPALGR